MSPRPSVARLWFDAARPRTLTASIAPVLVGSAIPAMAGHFRPAVFLAALVGSLFIQIGANYANDLFDFRRGADRADRLGPPRATATGTATPRQMGSAAAIAFGLGAVCGIYLVSVGGPPILVVGLASIVAAITYVGGPWPYGYHGLGDPVVFLFLGVIPVVTLTALHGAPVSAAAFAGSLPVACLVTALLSVNNLRDRVQDETAQKRTLAVLIGDRAARAEYVVLLTIAYLIPAAGAIAGLWPATALLAWLSAPLARPLLLRITKASGRDLNPVLGDTARLLLAFGALFALGLVIGH